MWMVHKIAGSNFVFVYLYKPFKLHSWFLVSAFGAITFDLLAYNKCHSTKTYAPMITSERARVLCVQTKLGLLDTRQKTTVCEPPNNQSSRARKDNRLNVLEQTWLHSLREPHRALLPPSVGFCYTNIMQLQPLLTPYTNIPTRMYVVLHIYVYSVYTQYPFTFATTATAQSIVPQISCWG